MTRPGLEPAPPASEANALTITLSGPVNAAYQHDRHADKRRYPHDREIDIQNVKMFRN